ncbi:ribosomal protein S18-alanine N-acetyltransferase [Kordiimonas lacus]|uniref:Ribosomal-protein-alanine N-acetyltransferase n=1 Tax=Kordiimonas lacus TaxID=637679 RepID=A0A1G7EAW9_9PROT|nr:ribosomal protein S18-alanine N-acetyltransferase [Kordiimonas lacus]SDE60793.1 ribosomal-protein-alanine N-acetyltransferase [Kordiimonas lacus]
MSPVSITPFPKGWDAGYGLLADLHDAAFSPQGDRPWSAGEFRQLVESSTVEVFLAHQGDQPLGFTMVRTICDEAELISIGVDPVYHGRGVAGCLLDEVTKNLAGAGVQSFFLEVREDNVAALKLYESKGFKPNGRRPEYYQTQSGSRVDALCLTLILGACPNQTK